MKTALGRGLKALLPDAGPSLQEISIKSIQPNRRQPRKEFSEESLKELAESIREKGLLQPIIVRRLGDGRYEIIAGERRWRAAQEAGLKTVPVIVKDVSEGEVLEMALVENIQRDDLNPLEMAEAFSILIRDFNYTQEELSKRIGKDRATISNYLRILKLPPEIKEELLKGNISLGHAKAILSLPTKQAQIDVTRKVLSKGLSVRQTEQLCKGYMQPEPKQKKEKDPNISALEKRLSEGIGARVSLKDRGGKGRLEIYYHDLDELDRLISLLLDK